MVIRNLKITISRDEVFRQIDCHEDSDLYEEIVAEYQEVEKKIYSLCEPVCLMEYTGLDDQPSLKNSCDNKGAYAVIYSVGKKVSDYSTSCFSQGNYLKGVLADAMADSALYSMENEIEAHLKAACQKISKGIGCRLEAPHDIPMELQKYIFEKTDAEKSCGFHLSTGYMIDPVKSNAILFLLTDNQEQFHFRHDCRKCDRYNCKQRHIPDIDLLVTDQNTSFSLSVKEHQSILDALILKDAAFHSICGGTGKCGKCKIRVIEGSLPITDFDAAYFTEKELTEGMRLSCRAYPQTPVTIELHTEKETDFSIVAEHNHPSPDMYCTADENYGIAVDIGTTTIAMQLLGLSSKTILKTYTSVNHQRHFGADVIARIQASVDGKRNSLQLSVRSDLLNGIEYLLEQSGTSKENVKEIVISGNTTMIHLLKGYECNGLKEFPFTPVNIHTIEESFQAVFHSDYLDARVRILPGISAFVGGDIVAGLVSCNFDKNNAYSILIDLGTNGELALGNSERIITTSTAAGPAFEGGNIVYGTGSINGAISRVNISDGYPRIATIGNEPPIGICGTGVIETTAELLKAGYLDESGCFIDRYFQTGYPLASKKNGEIISFTQRDVREIQLAKAAVRAGIETLFLKYGITKFQVENVYLAGGFGYKLNCDKAVQIGMLPEEFSGKIIAIGNSSLNGAVKCLLSEDGFDRAERITRISNEINLSSDKYFNEQYPEYMYFE